MVNRHPGVDAHQRVHIARAIVRMCCARQRPRLIEISFSLFDASPPQTENARVHEQPRQQRALFERARERDAPRRLFDGGRPVARGTLVLDLDLVHPQVQHGRVKLVRDASGLDEVMLRRDRIAGERGQHGERPVRRPRLRRLAAGAREFQRMHRVRWRTRSRIPIHR